jgi:hypothetical protein
LLAFRRGLTKAWFGNVHRNSSVIWSKTDAGRAEMQARALVKERAQRNLLLVIDGIKSEEMLLADLAGISRGDFVLLETLGLIAPAAAPPGSRSAGTAPGRGAAPPNVAPGPSASAAPSAAPAPGSTATPPLPAPEPAEAAPLDYAQFTATLTQLISKELGLRGFVLTLAVEKAGTIEELQAVAQRVLTQINERKGEAAAVAARRSLYGA